MPTVDKERPILVTGASGYIASWIVRFLLEEGHEVHATVRDKTRPEKVAHLTEIASRESGTLRLFEADLLKPGSFAEAMEGCALVLHTASPFQLDAKDPQRSLIDPALEGTRNVLKSAKSTPSVQRVVLTSSVAAIYGDAIELKDAPGQVFTEEQWNESSSLKHQPYSYSKTVAEREAWKIAGTQSQWDLVTINPSFVMGPALSQRTDGTSTSFMQSMANGQFKAGAPDLYFGVVDVREVARAHLLAGLLPEAEGRHIVSASEHPVLEMGEMLREAFGDRYPFPKKLLPNFLLYLFGPFQGFSWKFLGRNLGYPLRFNNRKSRAKLGLQYRPVSETLQEHLQQLEKDGLLKS
ncbi:MAG: aldehyde reductase [Phaeodactylibacter sp.]|uniref:SDR family oxidoreductase n=1 Tax=Phaeodactylibacter sp. TaxID=1940289 RepID=UPI0032ED67D7